MAENNIRFPTIDQLVIVDYPENGINDISMIIESEIINETNTKDEDMILAAEEKRAQDIRSIMTPRSYEIFLQNLERKHRHELSLTLKNLKVNQYPSNSSLRDLVDLPQKDIAHNNVNINVTHQTNPHLDDLRSLNLQERTPKCPQLDRRILRDSSEARESRPVRNLHDSRNRWCLKE